MHDTMTQPLPLEQRRFPGHASSGDAVEPAALPLELGELLRELYSDIKRLARTRTRRLPKWWSLRTTGLVHEAFLRLQRRDRRAWATRSHFMADVAQAMRDIAVEYVRGKQAKKRGGHMARMDSGVLGIGERDDGRITSGDKLAVFQALERLRAEHAQVAEIVFLRFFCDMTMEEIAEWLGITTRTVERKWAFARTWLETELGLQ